MYIKAKFDAVAQLILACLWPFFAVMVFHTIVLNTSDIIAFFMEWYNNYDSSSSDDCVSVLEPMSLKETRNISIEKDMPIGLKEVGITKPIGIQTEIQNIQFKQISEQIVKNNQIITKITENRVELEYFNPNNKLLNTNPNILKTEMESCLKQAKKELVNSRQYYELFSESEKIISKPVETVQIIVNNKTENDILLHSAKLVMPKQILNLLCKTSLSTGEILEHFDRFTKAARHYLRCESIYKPKYNFINNITQMYDSRICFSKYMTSISEIGFKKMLTLINEPPLVPMNDDSTS